MLQLKQILLLLISYLQLLFWHYQLLSWLDSFSGPNNYQSLLFSRNLNQRHKTYILALMINPQLFFQQTILVVMDQKLEKEINTMKNRQTQFKETHISMVIHKMILKNQIMYLQLLSLNKTKE